MASLSPPSSQIVTMKPRRPDAKPDGKGWRVLNVDGEMHIADIQERVRQLRNGLPKLDKEKADENLSILARQH